MRFRLLTGASPRLYSSEWAFRAREERREGNCGPWARTAHEALKDVFLHPTPHSATAAALEVAVLLSPHFADEQTEAPRFSLLCRRARADQPEDLQFKFSSSELRFVPLRRYTVMTCACLLAAKLIRHLLSGKFADNAKNFKLRTF